MAFPPEKILQPGFTNQLENGRPEGVKDDYLLDCRLITQDC
jgi:hypothetical protein